MSRHVTLRNGADGQRSRAYTASRKKQPVGEESQKNLEGTRGAHCPDSKAGMLTLIELGKSEAKLLGKAFRWPLSALHHLSCTVDPNSTCTRLAVPLSSFAHRELKPRGTKELPVVPQGLCVGAGVWTKPPTSVPIPLITQLASFHYQGERNTGQSMDMKENWPCNSTAWMQREGLS